MVQINERFQALHTQNTKVDWVAVQAVERDICLLYHQLADYSYIMGDLYYGDVFGLPYWEYLDVQGLAPEQRDFLRIGCLVILFAMASEVVDGSGAYLTIEPNRYAAALAAVQSLSGLSADDDVQRLANGVRHALEMIEAGASTWDNSAAAAEMNTLTTWIHERFVRRYFEDRVKDFSTNPYYRGQTSEDT